MTSPCFANGLIAKAGMRWASTWSAPSCESSSTTKHARELVVGAVLVGEDPDGPGDRLAVVEVRDALALGLVEEEAVGRPGDGVDAEVVGPLAPAVVLEPGLVDVVADRARARPEMPV